ncbi:hypothetical protein Pcinc_023294 [Petrolisthes cinctipes]|uniref:FYVE-type domain-containing protein n=1 Tax=Petrolisthes cinctipes TaxID=88211 RepID=A0AAE1FCV2_PETCI|nr:hypothetical protein Pcinc_023294 [Petrolisthes cinctipes]
MIRLTVVCQIYLFGVMSSVVGEGEVLEGFFCPFCYEDQNSVEQLLTHVEDKHSSEEKVVLQAFKGLLNKAKKKLLNEDEPDNSGVRQRTSNLFDDEAGTDYQSNNPWHWEPPSFDPSRNHTSLFKKIRSARIDSSVAETNKLLIRLDKLLRDLPNDPVKRKAHERSIVMWAEDRDVPLCPFCARSFNLARRRHHCRLCGGIMCDQCSHFITFNYAKKLVSPVHQGSSNSMAGVLMGGGGGSGASSGTGMTSLLSGFPGLRRSDSQGSLNSILSVMDSITGEQHFRSCTHCTTRLNIRDSQVEQRTSKPTIAMYYEKLMEYRSELEKLIPQYIRMAESLRCGETTYALPDVEELRVRILKKGDGVISLAQRIRTLGSPEPGEEDSMATSSRGPRQELLQRRIHSTSTAFLKEHILSLPKIPSPKELKELQERRRMEVEARLAAKKEAARQAEVRAAEILRRREKDSRESPRSSHSRSSSLTPPSFASLKKTQHTDQVVVDTGWGADPSAHNVSETDDPLIQQVNIIKNTIKQARIAGRYEDIPLLEANLRELQEEYKTQQRLMNP